MLFGMSQTTTGQGTKGKATIPGAMAAAAYVGHRPGKAGERVVDVDLPDLKDQSVGDLSESLNVEQVDVVTEGATLGDLKWDVDEDDGDTGALLPVKPMLGGALAAAVVLAGLFVLRQGAALGPEAATAGQSTQPAVLAATADRPAAIKPTDATDATDATGDPAAAPAGGVTLARVSFGTFATQADAEAICFELWTHGINAEVVQTGDGWGAQTSDAFDPEHEDVGQILKVCNDLLLPADLIEA